MNLHSGKFPFFELSADAMALRNAAREKRGAAPVMNLPSELSGIRSPKSGLPRGHGIHGKGELLRKYERINLGLALLSLVAQPGEPLTAYDIAAWCGCTHQRITQIEASALAKLRRRVGREDLAALQFFTTRERRPAPPVARRMSA